MYTDDSHLHVFTHCTTEYNRLPKGPRLIGGLFHTSTLQDQEIKATDHEMFKS